MDITQLFTHLFSNGSAVPRCLHADEFLFTTWNKISSLAVLLHSCHSIPDLKEAFVGTRQWGIARVGVAVAWIFAGLWVDIQGDVHLMMTTSQT